MQALRGFEAECSYKVGGVAAGGDWVPTDNIKDNAVKLDKTSIDASTRASAPFKTNRGGLIDASIEFDMKFDPDDDFFTLVQSSFLSGEYFGFRALSQPFEEGGQGLEADMEVFSFEKQEPLDGVQWVKVSMKPIDAGTAPAWVEG